MKKIYFIAIIVLLASCSKDDDNSLPINYSNMMGKWNIKSLIKADGSTINYVGLCPTQRDYFELTLEGSIRANRFYEDCVTIGYDFCSDFDLNADNVINTCMELDEGEVTQLSENSLRIEYPEPIYLDFLSISEEDIKAVIFEKRQ